MFKASSLQGYISRFVAPAVLLLLYLIVSDELAYHCLFINWALVGLLIYKGVKSSAIYQKISPIDCVVGGYLLYQLVALFCSSYLANSLEGLLHFITVFLFYCAVRFWGVLKREQIQFLLQGLAILFGFLGLFSLFSFSMFKFNVEYEGFTDIINFKNLYHPLGQLSNLWTSHLLLFLPFPVIAFIHSDKSLFKWINIVSTAVIILAIIVSFSRGAYLALITFVVAFLFFFLVWRIKPMKHLSLLGGLLLMISAGGLLYFSPVSDTLAFNKTTSQVRSVSGRQDLWSGVWDMFVEHPACGVGQGNATLNFNSYLSKSEDTFYTNRVTNSLLQLLAEQGIIGVLFWLGIVSFVLKYLWLIGVNKTEDIEWRLSVLVIISALAALFVREMTFSSFFDAPKLQLLFFVVVAILVNLYQTSNLKKTSEISEGLRKYYKIGGVLLLLLLGGTSYYTINQLNGKNANDDFIENYELGDNTAALENINKAIDCCPHQALFYAHRALALASSNEVKSIKVAIDDLLLATALSPNDAMFFHNHGSLHLSLGDTINAEVSLKRAVELDPFNPLYAISYSKVESGNPVLSIMTAIKCSPEVLSSSFGSSLEERSFYLSLSDSLYKWAKEEESNPIIAGRKAKVLLYFDEEDKAEQLMLDLINQLPNLNRPWCYLGLIALGKGDTVVFKKNMARSLLLDNNDYLPHLVLANYNFQKQMYNDAIYYYKAVLRSYNSINSLHSIKSRGYYCLRTVANDVWPNERLVSIKQHVNMETILENLMFSLKVKEKEEQLDVCQLFLSGELNLNQLVKELSEASK